MKYLFAFILLCLVSGCNNSSSPATSDLSTNLSQKTQNSSYLMQLKTNRVDANANYVKTVTNSLASHKSVILNEVRLEPITQSTNDTSFEIGGRTIKRYTPTAIDLEHKANIKTVSRAGISNIYIKAIRQITP